MMASNEVGHAGPSIETLRLAGGRLCLDFTNTVDPRIGKQPHDFLASYTDLVKWSRRVGVLTEDEAQHLLSEALHRCTEATKTWERAIELREMIYRVFSSVAHGTVPQVDDLEALRNVCIEAMSHAQIIPTSDGFIWDCVKDEVGFDRMLWSVARSAVELLTSQEVKRVKMCPGLGDCGWLFLDTSKNGSRLWCSMEGCGSRSKMRQQYARKRAGRDR